MKSKPNLIRMSHSRLTRSCFVMLFFSLSLSKLIILEKDGCMGYSSLAAKSIDIVDKLTIFCNGKFQWPMMERYLSNMLHAQNRVSIL